MSNLPHPLGDANPGDLFYPGMPSVTAYDLAGPAGSRAVEFGEDGISAAVNRGILALAKNDEHSQIRLEAAMAKMVFTPWAVTGGAGLAYVFSLTDLFVGDVSYLPETQLIRDSLISVLDENYNELLDPVTGHKVVVVSLSNAADELLPDPGSIVGDRAISGGDENGFYVLGAIARFALVNPVTQAVIPPGSYTIPDGTAVIFAHGVSGILDTLATPGSEHLMRDAFVSGSIRAAHEIHSASFLKDGSRPATSSFNMGGNDINGISALRSQPALPMGIVSFDDLFFSDQHATAVPLSEPGAYGASMFGNHGTLVGGINGQVAAGLWLHGGSRFKNRSGVFGYTDGVGTIDYPVLEPVVMGEAHYIEAGSTVANDTGAAVEYLVVQEGGASVALRSSAGTPIQKGDTIVSQHRYTAGAFVTADTYDLRWPAFRASQTLEMTVGSAVGSDFDDLSVALDVADRLAAVWHANGYETTVSIKIKGIALFSSTVNLAAATPFSQTINITGDGVGSEIRVGGTFTQLYCNGRTIDVSNLSIKYNDVADSVVIFFQEMGEGSRISNVQFDSTSSGNGLRVANSLEPRIVIENCHVVDWVGFLAELNAGAYDSVVRDCTVTVDPSLTVTDPALIVRAPKVDVTRNKFYGPHPVIVDVTGTNVRASISFCEAEYAAAPAALSPVFVRCAGFRPVVKCLFNRMEGYRYGLQTDVITGVMDINFSFNTIERLHVSSLGAMVLASSTTVDGGSLIVKGNASSFTDDNTSLFSVNLDGVLEPIKVDISDNDWVNGSMGDLGGWVSASIHNNRIVSPTYTGLPILRLLSVTAHPDMVWVTNNNLSYKARVVGGIWVGVRRSQVIGNKLFNSDVLPDHQTSVVGQHNFVKALQSAAPGGPPPAGDRYILANGHTGWTGVADGTAAGKIVEGDGASWGLVPLVGGVPPTDQMMVFNQATESWYVHEGAYPGNSDAGWTAAGATGILLSDASFEPWTCIVEDNYFERGIHFFQMGDLWGHTSVSFNHVQDCLGCGYSNLGPSNGNNKVVGNRFVRVLGFKLWSASGFECYVLKSVGGGLPPETDSDISHNTFYYCGPQFGDSDVLRVIWVEGGVVSKNQIIQPRCGHSDGWPPLTVAELIYIGIDPTICEGNLIRFNYGGDGGLDHTAWPYDLTCIKVVGVLSFGHVVNNKMWIGGVPKVGSNDLTGIEVSGANSQVSLNSMNGVDATNLNAAIGVFTNEPLSGGVYVGNLTGDVFEPLSQNYIGPGGAASGMAVGNRAHAAGVTAVGNYPLNGGGDPIPGLRDELNR